MKQKSVEKIYNQVTTLNIVIRIGKDLENSMKALQLARQHIKFLGFRPYDVDGWIYIDGVECSDLIIIEKINSWQNYKLAKVRSCTVKEHNKFLNKYLWLSVDDKSHKKFDPVII